MLLKSPLLEAGPLVEKAEMFEGIDPPGAEEEMLRPPAGGWAPAGGGGDVFEDITQQGQRR